MTDDLQVLQGPPDTTADKLRRAPNVLRTYASSFERGGMGDSDLPRFLRFVAEQLDLTSDKAAYGHGRSDAMAEIDDTIARLYALTAADIPADDDPDDGVPILRLAIQRWADGQEWGIALDDGRGVPDVVSRVSATEALTILAAQAEAVQS